MKRKRPGKVSCTALYGRDSRHGAIPTSLRMDSQSQRFNSQRDYRLWGHPFSDQLPRRWDEHRHHTEGVGQATPRDFTAGGRDSTLDAFQGTLAFSHQGPEIPGFSRLIQTVNPPEYPQDVILRERWRFYFRWSSDPPATFWRDAHRMRLWRTHARTSMTESRVAPRPSTRRSSPGQKRGLWVTRRVRRCPKCDHCHRCVWSLSNHSPSRMPAGDNMPSEGQRGSVLMNWRFPQELWGYLWLHFLGKDKEHLSWKWP